MLPKSDIQKIREELDNCQNPLFFFHDDPDGLCSFLLLYRYKKEGNGVCVKAVPNMDAKFIRHIEEYQPDKIFVLDIAMMQDEFVEAAKVPIVWVDHHEATRVDKVKCFNPRFYDKEDGAPVTAICYEVVQQDMWIAGIGCAGDWFIPNFQKEFQEKYPDLLPKLYKDPGDVLFQTKLGEMSKMFSFILKGKTTDVKKCYKTLTRIESPEELLKKETSRARFVFKHYSKVAEQYDELLQGAIKAASDDQLLIYIYPSSKMSFSGDIANEVLHKFPKKTILIGRDKSGEIRMSIRSPKKFLSILQHALTGVEGYGGGHENACGASVKKEDFDRFVEKIREQIQ
ncbi:MAG: DHH family phosphoesterase [Nanoarchaeota archaeon]|nr:DHH family phosphoesterase [Nanoarchaeota archaeon]